MFKTLNKWQRIIVILAIIFSFLISFYRWKNSVHKDSILQVYPEWEFNGYILYDGYGNYAEHIYNFIISPSRDSYNNLKEFISGYIHSSRPVYPIFVAIVNIVTRDILISSIIVNTIASLLCIYMLNIILIHHFSYKGKHLFYLNLLFISHISIIGMLGRPMTDALSLVFLFLTIHLAYVFSKDYKAEYLLLLIVVLTIAIFTKTILLMLAFTIPLSITVSNSKNLKRIVLNFVYFCIIPFILFIILILMLKRLYPDQATISFLFDCIDGAMHFSFEPQWMKYFIKAAILFLAVALQIYPIFILFNKDLFKLKFNLHLFWMIIYIIQRFIFAGFNLSYSRGRYGIPLVAGAIILAYPTIKKYLDKKWGSILIYGLVLLNYFFWMVLIIRKM